MKPVLYSPTETQFNTQGLGVLSDAISCTVTEARNGAFELQMVYGVDGIHYEDIKHSYIILAKPNEGMQTQPFRIYRITKPLNGRITVYAEHISYQMSHIPVKPFSAQSCAGALNALPSNAVESCPFTFWTDKSTSAALNITDPKSMRAVLGGENGSILDVYGGEYMFDRYLVRLYNERGSDRGVTLRYGKNITDITQEENIASTITGVMPFWKDGQSGSVLLIDEYVVYSSNANLYPYKRVVPVDFSGDFQEQPTKAQLKAKAQQYITQAGIGVPNVSIKVSLVSLWQTEEYKNMINIERINLCDTVTVQYPSLGVSAKAKVIKTVYDVLLERYTTIEIGEAKSDFASTLRSVTNGITASLSDTYATKSLLQQSVDRATEMITGGLGGHVVTVMDANGKPQELVILCDTDDIETAQKVWRWNAGGLGYSKTGYTGNYGLAITADGHIVADFVDTGTLTANVVKAGILSDVAGKNFWDMTTGEFQLASTTTIKTGSGSTATTASIGDYVADEVDSNMSQETIFNKLTNNGAAQGIYLKNGLLYLNATYMDVGDMVADRIKGGTLTLGGSNASKAGSIVVYDEENTEIGSWTKAGLKLKQGEISASVIKGGSLKMGGKNGTTGENGEIIIYDRAGAMAGIWNNGGMAIGAPFTYTVNTYMDEYTYSGNFTVTKDGNVTAKSFTANNYIKLLGKTNNSYFKMPCGDQTGVGKGYLEMDGSGITVYQNGMTSRLAYDGFPTDGTEPVDYLYNYTGFRIEKGSYLLTLTRSGVYCDYKYSKFAHLDHTGLSIGEGTVGAPRFTAASTGFAFRNSSKQIFGVTAASGMYIDCSIHVIDSAGYSQTGITKECVVVGKTNTYTFKFAKGICYSFSSAAS